MIYFIDYLIDIGKIRSEMLQQMLESDAKERAFKGENPIAYLLIAKTLNHIIMTPYYLPSLIVFNTTQTVLLYPRQLQK